MLLLQLYIVPINGKYLRSMQIFKYVCSERMENFERRNICESFVRVGISESEVCR